jgi:protease I
MPKRVLIPLPHRDFDPTEVGVPWSRFRAAGVEVAFATPGGGAAAADPVMLTGEGLGPLGFSLPADRRGREAYQALEATGELQRTGTYAALRAGSFDALLLPGGHAPGMRECLESAPLQRFVAEFAASGKPWGAICHGVMLAARARREDGRSVLHGMRTTGLPRWMERTAYQLTRLWKGSYYLTYPHTVEEEATAAVGPSGKFLPGPFSLRRDFPGREDLGFTVRDGSYLSARWPGDAHRLARDLLGLLA